VRSGRANHDPEKSIFVNPDTATSIPESIRPQAYRVYPGWWMLAVAAAAQYMSGPGQSYSVAAFKEPMQDSLQISDTRLSLAYGFATLLSGLSLPFMGRLVDRWGARRILIVVAGVLGTACLWMSQVRDLAGLYIGFSLIRCFGQGALMLISMWIVGEWYAKRRGFAASLVGLGGSLSVMTLPLINHFFISRFGWEVGWMFWGVAVWLSIIPPTFLLLRDRPEELGLSPDGFDEQQSTIAAHSSASNDPAESKTAPIIAEQRRIWGVSDVLRDATFWKLLSVPACAGLIITALTFHQVAILGSRGVDPGWALGLISLQAVIATACALPAGWLTDRMTGRHLLAAAMCFLGLAAALVIFMPVPQLAVLYAVCLGLNGALMRTAGNVIWLEYYGRDNQGGIRGLVMSAMVLGAAIGPLPAAFSIDYLGSYQLALWSFVAMAVVAGTLAFTAPPPTAEY
jgi:MFS family permease